MFLFTGENFLSEPFPNKGFLSTDRVECAVHTVLWPEVSCAGRAWLSGHEDWPHAPLWASVWRLEALYERFVACSLILGSCGGNLQRPEQKVVAKKQAEVSLTGCSLGKCLFG